jgi:hypothetical protein
MKREDFEEGALGPKEVVIALRPDSSFESIVKSLESILTLPEVEGFGGCRPCLSGLDRLVVQTNILRRIR